MVFCDDALGSSVADCRKHGAGVTSDQARANAHLIAAAPDLLAACKLAERHHQGMHSEPGIALRAAIAKAEGR